MLETKMKTKLDDVIDHTEDTVRFYPLCKKCIGKVEFSGIGEMPRNKPYAVI